MDNKELLKIAKEAKSKSYCPYSKFKVGACLLTKSGKQFQVRAMIFATRAEFAGRL